MVDTQDIWRKKSGGGFVSENPLSSAQTRAANPLSSTRPHASSTSTPTKPQPSAPSPASTVSVRQGDTLSEIAQKKLGDGNRWRELHKADGSRFTGQEARHLQVGTRVYLTGAKLTPSPASTVSVRQGDTLSEIAQKKLGDGNRWRELHKADGSRFTGQEARHLQVGARVHLPGVNMTTETPHPVMLRSSTPRVSTQVLRPEGITRREFSLVSTSSTRSTQLSASPALSSRTSSQLVGSKGITRREYFNASNYKALSAGGNRDSSNSTNNNLNQSGGVAKGVALGGFVASRKLSQLKATALTPQRQSPNFSSIANSVTGKTQPIVPLMPQSQSPNSSSRRIRPAFEVVGDINEKAWTEFYQSREKAGEIRGYSNNRRAWRDQTGKVLKPARYVDGHFEVTQTGEKLGTEQKASSAAAELRNAPIQRARDTNAIKIGASVEGVKLDRVVYLRGLPVHGPGGNTDEALGRPQKHIVITPQGGAEPLPSTWAKRVKILGGYKKSPPHLESRAAKTTPHLESRAAKTTPHLESRAAKTTPHLESRAAKTTPHLESRAAKTTPRVARTVGESRSASVVLRGASRVAAPVAVGLDAWNLKNAYQKDGFGQEFRKEAGRVAGGWGGAAAGAAIGSFAGPPGMIVGGIIGGVAGSEFGDDIEQGAEKAGKAVAGGAKKAWNKLFG